MPVILTGDCLSHGHAEMCGTVPAGAATAAAAAARSGGFSIEETKLARARESPRPAPSPPCPRHPTLSKAPCPRHPVQITLSKGTLSNACETRSRGSSLPPAALSVALLLLTLCRANGAVHR